MAASRPNSAVRNRLPLRLYRRMRPWVESLEPRLTPDRAFANLLDSPAALDGDGSDDVHKVIVAGDPNGTPTDSPSLRVDPNTTTSPYAGVGSLQINTRRGTYICTATPISSQHILTGGHCVDINDDGKSNSKDGIRSIYFLLNYGGNLTHQIPVSKVNLHPDFTGFNRPSINDDIAVLTLASALPEGVPVYGLPSSDLAAGTTLTLVGYGQSGNGVTGYTVNASFSVKRKGENNADAFYGQDDAGKAAANEVFRYDFDGPSGNGTFGGSTLGNARETTLGGGDSGGPSFVGNVIVGVNTFTQGFTAPRFGSLGGGINVFPYLSFINSVVSQSGSASSTSTHSGGGGSGGNATLLLADDAADTALVEPPGQAVGIGVAFAEVPDPVAARERVPASILSQDVSSLQSATAFTFVRTIPTPPAMTPPQTTTRLMGVIPASLEPTRPPPSSSQDVWVYRLASWSEHLPEILPLRTEGDAEAPPSPRPPAGLSPKAEVGQEVWRTATEAFFAGQDGSVSLPERVTSSLVADPVPGPVLDTAAGLVSLVVLLVGCNRRVDVEDEQSRNRVQRRSMASGG